MKIVITGTSSGIGLGLARFLTAAGHEVIGLSRRGLAEPIERKFRAISCDVTDFSQVRQAASEVGGCQALICCAAAQGLIGPAMTIPPEEWVASVTSNIAGVFIPLHAFYPRLREARSRGKVICFSGGGATRARPYFSAYGTAKTALVRLVETLAEEWRAEPIDINALAPGAISTAMTEAVVRAGPEKAGAVEYEQARKTQETGGVPLEKVTALVDFLLSPASNGITGRLLSAAWDDWSALADQAESLQDKDWYQLRRVNPENK